MEVKHLPIEEIRYRTDARQRSYEALAELEASINKIGLINPIRVRAVGDAYEVIAGAHRLQALDLLGWREIPCIITTDDDIAAEMAMIAENLHRAELTALERDVQIARWAELEVQRLPAQVAPAVLSDGRNAGPQHSPSGINAASRGLGIERTDAQRAAKVASLSDEAKEAAREIGLDNNRTALLEAAKYPTPEAQVQALQQRKAGGIASRFAPATTLSQPEVPSRIFERFVSLVDEIEAVPIPELHQSAGRHRSVLGQRASGLADRMGKIMEALD
ncbi:ParB/RepB/Spo0J family partition protein [Mesorhizobium sp. A556]